MQRRIGVRVIVTTCFATRAVCNIVTRFIEMNHTHYNSWTDRSRQSQLFFFTFMKYNNHASTSPTGTASGEALKEL
ncbi:hypothetical protein T492DRAFT_949673 [Pavlovales sp. CCMP2436]|nr:hypothetical protein T492DRAFT_949673 [Pavlovales sp. CCMP2436]